MGNTLFGGAAKVSAGRVSAAAAVLQVLVASRRPRCHEHGAEDQQGELLPHVTRDTRGRVRMCPGFAVLGSIDTDSAPHVNMSKSQEV